MCVRVRLHLQLYCWGTGSVVGFKDTGGDAKEGGKWSEVLSNIKQVEIFS